MPSITHAARTIKRHNCIPNIELQHAGKFSGIPNLENPHPKYKPYGPMKEKYSDGTIVYQMDEGRMEQIAEDFATGAKRVKDAGFEMLMVQGAHG
jgi:2,4-dienoyl-CoA reductase-like NADH-dependent reductase (Old Yellow Enzyme family)